MSFVSKEMRALVRKRANERCEYCRKPDTVSNYSHHVDHIIPLKHEGLTISDNLAWACFQCNTTKSSDVASYEDSVLVPLFNPRTQNWNDHFEMNGAIIVGKTAIGRVTIRTLQLNHPDQIETRQRLINANQF